MENKRFAVLLCEEASEYMVKNHGGYLSLFMGLLGEEGETWDEYHVFRNEFPDEEELELYDGFVISGSRSDAHGDDVWISKLLSLLRKLDSMHKKVLGVCFGHQIVARALGGKTGRSTKGWDIGVTTINLSRSSRLLASLKIPSSLPLIECHRDEVLELPPLAEVIGWSEKTGIEMFRCGDHIMGIQGHPEFTKDILLHIIDRYHQSNLIQSHQAGMAKASLNALEAYIDAWKKLSRSFLKGELSF